jgi:hypothetical protein
VHLLSAAARSAWIAALLLLPAGVASASCPHGVIDEIVVRPGSVFAAEEARRNGDSFAWAFRLANRLHVPTRPSVIERELLFREGDCLDPELIEETERILRFAPFLADAEISVRPAAEPGRHRVVVTTRDEWSLRVEPRMEGGGRFTALTIQEENLLGTGRQVAVFYRENLGDEQWGASFTSPQLLRTRWRLSAEGARTHLGHLAAADVAYPFTGREGRWAYRVRGSHHDRAFEFIAGEPGALVSVLFPERRRFVDAGVVRRFGTMTRQILLGFGASGEWIAYPGDPWFGRRTPDELQSPALFDPLGARMDSVASVRATLLAGQRSVRYVQRRGVRAVNAPDDLPLGVEFQFGLGQGIRALSTGEDLAVEVGVFASEEAFGRRLTSGIDLFLEGKRDYVAPADETEWEDVLAELNLWTLWNPVPDGPTTIAFSLVGAGAWHTGVPFQLTMGGGAGLRGYPRHVYPAGHRLVGSAEYRRYVAWPFPDLFDLGTVLFVDAGRSWAGDVPYGVDSPGLIAVGGGIRAAFPPGSRQTFRLDVGMPVTGARVRDVVFTAGVGQAIGPGPRERDPQIARSTRRTLTTADFIYP